ncbi:MAG TPA: 3-methyl-2-oxobutanoate hydroxymethyltransferase [Actinomycetes bacterium]|jgi:3-methyl-2-oxobutanoate hydroxymethyltransferase|nr:3-methyl-2-oxobutanoate hydroxymethyltransferase [Actinomycetes bacterium]
MPVTIHDLAAWKARGERFIMLTAYDALTARVLDEAGVPLLLVGDSLGNNVLGYDSTVPVTMEDSLVFTAAVARGAKNAMIVGDLPFGSFQASAGDAMRNAARLVKAGANAVKLEGGRRSAKAVRKISDAGVPVMGHLGLTPQSFNSFGGFRVQGRGEQGDALLAEALALQDAGCFAIVLEAIPAELGGRITGALEVATIGIGAGPHCDGQVLVITDLLGLTPDPTPRFVKRYADLRGTIAEAAKRFAKDVAEGHYPAPEHQYR